MKSCPGNETSGWRKLALGVLLITVTFGGGPTACLSDVVIPECFSDGTCGGSGGGAGVSGSAGMGDGSAGEVAGGGAGDSDGGADSGGADSGSANAASDGAGSAGTGAASGGAGSGRAGGASAGAGSAGGGALGGAAGAENGGAGNGGTGAADGDARGTAGTTGRLPPPLCPNGVISPGALPAPCQSNPYSTALYVSGGVAPYTWSVTAASGQWSMARDASSASGAKGRLSGQAAGPTSLTVEAMDGTGCVVRETFDIKPRTACWFAYTALEATGPQLKLVDPILEQPPSVQPAHDNGVYDFAFSPNGRYLAYRYGADATYPKGRHLSILSLSNWTEATLSLTEDAVTSFSWISDSSVLAVAFQSGSSSYLGGVKLRSTSEPGFPATIETLTAKPAFVDSPLYWLPGNNLAFHGTVLLDPISGAVLPNPFTRRTPSYAALGSTSFTTPVPFPNASYAPTVSLQPAENGFFMIGPSTNFYSLPSATVARHQFIDVVAPSSHFTAELDDGQLLIFDAAQGNLADATHTSADYGDCPKLLAWSKGSERIACVANVESDPPGKTHGEVRMFDIQQGPTLSMRPLPGFCEKDAPPVITTCSDSEYDYTEENSEVQARAFSSSGRWFAFTTTAPGPNDGGYLYVADLNAQQFVLKHKVHVSTSSMTSSSPSALAFSADERFLLLQLGNSLTGYDLLAPSPLQFGTSVQFVSDELIIGTSQASSPCSEDFPSAPGRWCGAGERVLPFSWAPDSRYAAYRAEGQLRVVDFTQFNPFATHQLAATDCNGQCASQFAFQPQP